MRGLAAQLTGRIIASLKRRPDKPDTGSIYRSIDACAEGEQIGIPTYTAQGDLPPGRHRCDLLAFQERFTWNARRRELFDGLLELVFDLETCGCKRIIVGGSFVTYKNEPGDFEGLWQADEVDMAALARLQPALLADRPEHPIALEARYGGSLAPWYRHGLGGPGLLEYLQYDDRCGRRKGVVVIDI